MPEYIDDYSDALWALAQDNLWIVLWNIVQLIVWDLFSR